MRGKVNWQGYPSLRCYRHHYNKRQITKNQCSLHPQCTVHYLSVSGYVQWNCLAWLSSKNIALNMVNTNLIVTQSEDNFCVSKDWDE